MAKLSTREDGIVGVGSGMDGGEGGGVCRNDACTLQGMLGSVVPKQDNYHS